MKLSAALAFLNGLGLSLAMTSLVQSDSDKLDLGQFELCLLESGFDINNFINQADIAAYQQLNHQWNTYKGLVTPAAFLSPERTADVQTAVICGKKLGIRLVPKGGGHSFLKYSYGDSESVVVDLGKLNSITVTEDQRGSGSCSVGAGTRVAHINWQLWQQGGWLIPAGLCPTVGIAGLALGGGFGFFTRLHGLTSDALIEAELVDASGKLLTVNNTTNADLFWALRGAGGGSFGIVTRLNFKLFRAPSCVLDTMDLYTDFDLFPAVFTAWQAIFASPEANALSNIASIFWVRRVQNSTVFSIAWLEHQSQNKNNSLSNLERIRASFPRPSHSEANNFTYPEFFLRQHSLTEANLPNLGNLTSNSVTPRLQLGKSIIVETCLDTAGVQALFESITELLNTGENISVFMEAVGGAVSQVPPAETAFVHRNAIYNVGIRFQGEEADADEARLAMNTFFEQTKPILKHSRSYQNYPDEDMDNYLRRYYGENLERLVQIKRMVDPENYFHNPQSVPTSV